MLDPSSALPSFPSHEAPIPEMADEQNNTPAKPNVLCDTCRGVITALQARFGKSVDIKQPNRAEIYPVLGSYLVHEVQASGLRGCHLCSLISQALCPAHSEHDISQISGSIIIKPSYMIAPSYDGTYRLDALGVQLMDSEGKRIRGDTLQIISDYNYHSNHPVPASWSISTGSDASFALAREWLDRCLCNHPLCEEIRATPISANKSPLPTYFVDTEPGNLHLCRSEDLPDLPPYLTLSHRWGNSLIFQLNTKNLTALLSEIPLSDLPKTFRDAIIVTRRLGYRYLWIDSLCIIQDSKEHWEQESAIMGEIYRHSTCTIAALGATDGDSGCFKTRNPLCFQLCEFELSADRVVYLVPPGHLHVLSTKHTGYGPRVEPLHERAWVIQEWMLSPRTLHYGTLGLYWECVTERSNDRVTKMMEANNGPKNAIHQACSLPMSGKVDNTYWEFWKWWKDVILMYSPCGLTYGTDKLVAINGIVKLVESRAGLHNLAGLWKEYIFPELLWTVQMTKRPSGAYQAPTWSWASLNCEVNPGVPDHGYKFDWKIELLEAVAHPAAANGQLLSAHIRVRGPLQLVRWVKDENDYKLRWGDKVRKQGSADDRIYFLPDVEPDPKQELWALLVVHATADTTWMKMGLLVAKKDTGGEVWVRVGTFRQYDWPTSPTEFFQDGDAGMRELVIV